VQRRLCLLTELGGNAIRTSHNLPALELLDLCDRLGLPVKDEAFDEFTPAKDKWVSAGNVGQPSRFGCAKPFDRRSVIDVQDMVGLGHWAENSYFALAAVIASRAGTPRLSST
jgi:beta-galactosidase